MFWRRNKTPARKINVPKVSRTLTIQQWRKNPENVTRLRLMLQDPFFQDFLGVLYNSHPTIFPVEREPVSDVQSHIHLGKILGYQETLAIINAMTVYEHVDADLEADYGAD